MPADALDPRGDAARRSALWDIDFAGAGLLCSALVGTVLGLSQTQNHSVRSLDVWAPVAVAIVAGALFVRREQVSAKPLMSFRLLQTHPGYLASTISQTITGMIAIGLAVIFPLILILNLDLTPATAGLALLPTTVPLIILAPFVGRWYDAAGSRTPMIIGFVVLLVAALLLAVGVTDPTYLALLPGLTIYGIGIAIVITVNDPVDAVPQPRRGEAAGVQATAEQAGGAIGIAALYAMFHSVYSYDLRTRVDASPLRDLTGEGYRAFEAAVAATEKTGLDPLRGSTRRSRSISASPAPRPSAATPPSSSRSPGSPHSGFSPPRRSRRSVGDHPETRPSRAAP